MTQELPLSFDSMIRKTRENLTLQGFASCLDTKEGVQGVNQPSGRQDPRKHWVFEQGTRQESRQVGVRQPSETARELLGTGQQWGLSRKAEA